MSKEFPFRQPSANEKQWVTAGQAVPAESRKRIDPEEAIQERPSLLAWLLLFGFVFWLGLCRIAKNIRQWFRTKEVCAWCRPQRWIGGNPFARRITHGICQRCYNRSLSELTQLYQPRK